MARSTLLVTAASVAVNLLLSSSSWASHCSAQLDVYDDRDFDLDWAWEDAETDAEACRYLAEIVNNAVEQYNFIRQNDCGHGDNSLLNEVATYANGEREYYMAECQ